MKERSVCPCICPLLLVRSFKCGEADVLPPFRPIGATLINALDVASNLKAYINTTSTMHSLKRTLLLTLHDQSCFSFCIVPVLL